MSEAEEERTGQTSVLLRIIAAEVVRPSFDRCCQHGDSFFDSFYSNLADHLPDVGPMFATVDMASQNQLLQIGIGHLIGFAEGRTESRAELERIGISHRSGGLNVPLEWYSHWEATLCQTIVEHDSRSNDNVIAAWHEVLTHGLRQLMSMYEQ